MPFTKDDFLLFLETRTQDSNKGKFVDQTPYGTPNQDRNTTANILVVAKMDENQNLVFIPNIDNTIPLSALGWYFTTTPNATKTITDGAYRAFLMVFSLYSGAATYDKEEVDIDGLITQYADIIYHSGSNTFYKAIANSFTAIEPSVTVGWATYWEVFTNFSSYILSDRATVIIHIHDDTVTFKYEDCLKDELVDITDDILCGVCDKWEDLLKVVQMTLVLDETNSLNWQNKQTRGEVVIVEGTRKFCC